jgi:hypothetical protein
MKLITSWCGQSRTKRHPNSFSKYGGETCELTNEQNIRRTSSKVATVQLALPTAVTHSTDVSQRETHKYVNDIRDC